MSEIHDFHPDHILCPIDFSAVSDLALRYAATAARVYQSKLTVLHAERVELPPYFTQGQLGGLVEQARAARQVARDYVEKHVEDVLGSQARGFNLEVAVVNGEPAEAILHLEAHHDLVVMGTHARRGPERFWLGSVTENVVRHIRVPVLVVRQLQHGQDSGIATNVLPIIGEVLCPITCARLERETVRRAAWIARQFHARLEVLCVIEPGQPKHTPADMEVELLSEPVNGVVMDCVVEEARGDRQVADEILGYANRTRPDLIVVSGHRQEATGGWLWSNTTEWVLRRAPVPVLVVPQPGDRPVSGS